MPDPPRDRSHNAPKPNPPTAGKRTRLCPFSCSCPRTARGVLQNARADSPIAQTLDRDLGLLPQHLANPRPAGRAALNLETQSLGSRLGIGRKGKVDEIGRADLRVSKMVREFRARLCRAHAAIYRDIGIKNPYGSEYKFANSGRSARIRASS